MTEPQWDPTQPGGVTSAWTVAAPGPLPPHRPMCFGCGPDNEAGLGLQLSLAEDGALVADYRFPERFEGGPGVVHGGAICAVLDDLLGTVPLVNGVPAVTARLTVNYRRPVPVGADVRLRAEMTGRDGRKVMAKGEMSGADGTLFAEADGLFVAILPEHYAAFLPGENYP